MRTKTSGTLSKSVKKEMEIFKKQFVDEMTIRLGWMITGAVFLTLLLLKCMHLL